MLLGMQGGACGKISHRMRQHTVPVAASKPAEATLLALRAALPAADVRGDHVLVLPSPVPMNHDAAVARLAGLEKPAICYGFAVAQVLAVACWPDTARTDMIARGEADLRMPLYEQMRDNSGQQPDSRWILLQGIQESLALTGDEFVEWRRQYTLQFVNSLPGDPTEDQRQFGIGIVYHFSGREASDSGAVEQVMSGR